MDVIVPGCEKHNPSQARTLTRHFIVLHKPKYLVNSKNWGYYMVHYR
jgi:hypothetical protein